MANPIKVPGTGNTGPKQDIQALVEKGLSDIFKKAMLPADQDRSALGADAKKLVKDLEAQLKKASGTLAPADADDFVAKLKAALQGDKLKAMNLGAAPTGPAAFIPPSGDLVSKNGDGSYALAGAVGTPTHGLSQLLQKLGMDPSKIDGAAADRISSIVRGRSFSLSNQKDFEKLAIALTDSSPIKAPIAKPAKPVTMPALGAAPKGDAAALPAGELVKKNASGGYELAPGVGAGVSGLLTKLGFDPTKLDAGVADRLTSTIRAKGFDITNQASFEKLGVTLHEVSPAVIGAKTTNGKVEGSNTPPVRQGSASAPTTTGKGTAFNALNALISNKLSVSEDKTAADGLKKAAVDELLKGAGLTDVKPEIRAEVEKMLDKIVTDPQNATSPSPGRILQNAFVELSRATGDREWMKGAAFTVQLQAALDKLPAEARGPVENNLAMMAAPLMEAAAQAKLSKLTGGAAKLELKPSADALTALTSMLGARGVTPTVDVDKTLKEARTGATTQTGKVEDKRADGAFDAKAAARAFVKDTMGCNANDASEAKGIAGVEALLKRAGSMDPAAVTQAAYDIFKEKTGIDHPFKQHADQLVLDPQQAAQWRDQLLVKAAEAGANPKAFFDTEKANALNMQQQLQQQGGPNMQGPANGGIPGFLGTGMPGDMNPMRQMELSGRQMVIGSIIHDRSLTMEDKLFFIMMYLGMFANEDVLKKAEELAALDRADEQRADTTRRAQTSLQNEQQTRGAAKKAMDDASTKFQAASNQPNATPEVKEAAKKLLDATTAAHGRSVETERKIQNDVNTLKGPSNQPKSREALTMELRRMEDMKRLFQDTLQALMQSFKESTRNVIQGMNR